MFTSYFVEGQFGSWNWKQRGQPGGYCISQGDNGGNFDNGGGSGEEEANLEKISEEQIKHGDGWEVGVRE